MEVMIIEAEAIKAIDEKLDKILQHVLHCLHCKKEEDTDKWVDSSDVCRFLQISKRTLQRLRSEGKISFSRIRGKNYYKIGEIQRLMNEHLIRSNGEQLQNLISFHKNHVEKR